MDNEIANLIGKSFFWQEYDEETGKDQSGYYVVRMADKDNCWCYLYDANGSIEVEIELPTDWVIQLTDPDDNSEDWSKT